MCTCTMMCVVHAPLRLRKHALSYVSTFIMRPRVPAFANVGGQRQRRRRRGVARVRASIHQAPHTALAVAAAQYISCRWQHRHETAKVCIIYIPEHISAIILCIQLQENQHTKSLVRPNKTAEQQQKQQHKLNYASTGPA